MNYALGIDIGGRNIKAIAVTPQGRMLATAAIPTEESSRKAWQSNVRRLVQDITTQLCLAPTHIGIAAPGLPARDQKSIAVMPGRLPGLEGLVWSRFLKHPRPVVVLNDAQAALAGECWQGAARNADHAILLTLGTGVGGAAKVDGHLLRGHLGRAGHLGHISLNPLGAGDVANTPGSLEDAIGDCTVIARTNGRFNSTAALVAASRNGDVGAKAMWLDSVRALAAGIASLINVLDPEFVILGGGIAQAGPALFRPLNRFMRSFEWRPGGARARIVPAKLGDRAGAFGAAFHALQFSTTNISSSSE